MLGPRVRRERRAALQTAGGARAGGRGHTTRGQEEELRFTSEKGRHWPSVSLWALAV